MNVRYRVELSQAERAELTTLLSRGKHAARKLKRAQILVAADAGASDDEIARAPWRWGRLNRILDQAALRGRQSGASAERGPAPRRGPKAHRQGGGPAGGDCLCEPTGAMPSSSSPITKACRARPCADAWPRTFSSRGAATCGAFPRSMDQLTQDPASFMADGAYDRAATYDAILA